LGISSSAWIPRVGQGERIAMEHDQPKNPIEIPRPEVAKPTSGAPGLPRKGLDPSRLGKSFLIKGDINGSGELYIDGQVEGTVHLPGDQVTVGPNGMVAADITAAEVSVLGSVQGKLAASERVDIRRDGSLIGEVLAARISIEDGAVFKGRIDVGKSDRGGR
jgi:cytoskeletal protein CcmA (bactofilin family)